MSAALPRRVSSLVAILMLALPAGIASAEVTLARSSNSRLAANKAAAKADAATLLTEITLPVGASRTDPAISHPATVIGTSAGVTDETRWLVPGETPSQVIAAVTARPPRHVISSGSESSSGPGDQTSVGVMFSLKTVPDVLTERLVHVAASSVAGGSAVTVESESVWEVPRTARSTLPSSTRAITVMVRNNTGALLTSVTVRTLTRVRATVRFFNGLEAIQPFTVNCPSDADTGDVLTVDFLRGGDSSPAAQAVFDSSLGTTSAECNPVSLRIHGTAQDALLGGPYVRGLERALGVELPMSTRGPHRRAL